MRRTELTRRASLVAALAVSALSAACTDMYADRRDPVSFAAGDAVATNIAIQTVDPWPKAAGNRDIAYNGDRMQAAVERYRTGKVINPVGTSTSSVQYDPTAQQQPAAASPSK